LIGAVETYSGSSGYVGLSFAQVEVNALANSGGFAGRMISGSISDSFSYGAVNGAGSNMGGFLGLYGSGSVITSYWDTQTSGRASSSRGIAKTSAQLKTEDLIVANNPHIWSRSSQEFDGYPIVLAAS